MRQMLLPSHPLSNQNYIHRQQNGPFQPPPHSFPNESVNGSYFSTLSTGWSRPPAGFPEDVSDQAPGSFSELASKRCLSFNTPATRTNSSDGDYFRSNGEAVPLGQYSPDAERVLQGIRGTNYYYDYNNVETTTHQNVPYNRQCESYSDTQPMDVDCQHSISTQIPASTNSLQGPWSELHRTYHGRSYVSDMIEESRELQSMQYTYEDVGQGGALHMPSHEAYANNQQQHHTSVLTDASSSYQEDGRTNTGTPGSATWASGESPASSTTTATHIPGRRHGPLSLRSRTNAKIMRKKGSCFRCVSMRERCVMDAKSEHDGICGRCRDILNEYRTWNLPCSQLKLQDRLAFMLPDGLISHLRACKVREYIESNTNGSLTGFSFKLEIGIDFGAPLELDVVEFIPRGQETTTMRGFQLTATGSSTSVILDSPPIIPVLLDRSAIRCHISRWLDSVISEEPSNFPDQCFPAAHEDWQRDILANIFTYSQACLFKSETQEGRAPSALRRALKLTALNHIMCHPFSVPDDKVRALLGRLRNFQPAGPLEWVCPRVVNKVIKSYCVPMLKRVKLLVLERLHKIFRSTTAKEAAWDEAFSIVFLCLIAIGKNQVALVERAKVCTANDDDSFSLQDAVKSVKEMELEFSAHLIGMFHQRFSTKKGGSGKGKAFNPLARNAGGEPRSTTELMHSIRLATERYGWANIKSSAELPLSELLKHDHMKVKNVTRLLCTFMQPFAPREA